MAGPLENIDLGLSNCGRSVIDLEEILDGALSVIAFDDGSEDLNYIQERVKEIKSEYDSLVKRLGMAGSWFQLRTGLGIAVGSIIQAYQAFIYEDWGDLTSEKRRAYAETILGENLFIGGGEVDWNFFNYFYGDGKELNCNSF